MNFSAVSSIGRRREPKQTRKSSNISWLLPRCPISCAFMGNGLLNTTPSLSSGIADMISPSLTESLFFEMNSSHNSFEDEDHPELRCVRTHTLSLRNDATIGVVFSHRSGIIVLLQSQRSEHVKGDCAKIDDPRHSGQGQKQGAYNTPLTAHQARSTRL